MTEHKKFWKNSRRAYRFLIVVCILAIIGGIVIFYLNEDKLKGDIDDISTHKNTLEDTDHNKIEDGIHVRTGFIDAPGLMETVNNCTTCHSAKLVIQNRMSAERWHATIRWMQETQNLWDLGNNEDIIVNYLATNYPPNEKGRRQVLSNIEWYQLED